MRQKSADIREISGSTYRYLATKAPPFLKIAEERQLESNLTNVCELPDFLSCLDEPLIVTGLESCFNQIHSEEVWRTVGIQ